MRNILLFKKYDTNISKTLENRFIIFNYHSSDELPIHFDATLYKAFFFLVKEVGNPEVHYIQSLRLNGNMQPVYILQRDFSRSVAEKVKHISHCTLFENAALSPEKIEYIVHRIEEETRTDPITTKAVDSFFLNIPQPALSFSLEGKIQNANAAFLKNFKYRAERLSEMQIQSLIPGIEAVMGLSKNRQSLKTELSVAESTGNMIPCLIRLFRPTESENGRLVCLIEDISAVTEQRKRLQNLESSFTKFDQLLFRITKSAQEDDKKKQVCSAIQEILFCDRVEQILLEQMGKEGIEACLTGIPKEALKIFETMARRVEQLKTFSVYSGSAGPFKTIITFPQLSEDKVVGIVFAVYYNFIEPEPLKVRMAALMAQVCALNSLWRKAMQSIKNSESHFKALVENAQDGIYQSTPDGRILYANQALLRMLKFNSFQEMQEANLKNAIYAVPEKRSAFKEQLEKNGIVYNFSERLRQKDGSIISVIENAHVISKPNEPVIYEGIIRDVSKLKILEDKIEQEHKFVQELIDQAPVPIVAFDQNGKLVLWNHSMTEISGYTKSEIPNSTEMISKLYPDAAYRKKVISESGQQMNGFLERPLLFRLTTKAGQERTISWTSKQVHSAILGNLILSFGLDLTQLTQLEENILEAQKAEVLNKLYISLSERFKILLTEIKQKLEAQTRFSATNLIENINNGFTLIRDAQNFLQNKSTGDEHVRIDEIVKQVIDIVEKTVPRNIKIETNLHYYRMVKGDNNQLKQAVFNVVVNAVDAMPDGGLILVDSQLAHSGDPLPQGIHFPHAGHWAVIHIKDSGIGIREEDLEHLFEPFFSTRERAMNRGLGLTLTQRILREHGGDIQIISEPGKGTDAYLFLPEPKKKDSKQVTSQSHNKILIIDDETIIQELLQDVLQSEGYDIFSARDGQEGLELFQSKSDEIELVILDVILPKVDGKTVFTEIRKIKPEVKVLIISGYSKSDVKEELIQKGINGFIAKPFSIVHLLETVGSLLR